MDPGPKIESVRIYSRRDNKEVTKITFEMMVLYFVIGSSDKWLIDFCFCYS